MNIRALAALTITPVLQKKSSLTSPLEHHITQVSEKDKGLFQQLCFGSLRQFHELDGYAKALLSKALKNKDMDVYGLLIVGLFQLRHTRVPDHAAISETVDAAKKLKKPWAAKLINGVLRNYLRQRKTLEHNSKENISIHFSHPQWLIAHISAAWPEHWKEVLDQNNLQAPLTLRINPQINGVKQFFDKLKALDITSSFCKYSKQGITLPKGVNVTTLPNFMEGGFSVQDEAAQLAAPLLKLAPEQRVLDACCAPGGKTCHILELEAKLEELVAIDIDAARMQRVQENLSRLKLSATLFVDDVGNVESWWDKKQFDRILLDAPCSATGVIRRHPDIKLLRRADDLDKLTALQQQLLQKLWPLLKPGGLLVYATCSILPEENEKTVAQFLSKQKDALHIPIDATWGVERPFGRQLFPQRDGHDGFYYALLSKNEIP